MKKKLRTAFEKMRNYLERLHTGFTPNKPIEEGEEVNWKSTS
jgi:hypothetical protein